MVLGVRQGADGGGQQDGQPPGQRIDKMHHSVVSRQSSVDYCFLPPANALK
jgi:hypothetical protein